MRMQTCLGAAMLMAAMAATNTIGGETIMNVLANVPYADTGMGKRKVVDEQHLLIMQAALKPGQMVPQHDANSNVHILVLEGAITLNLNGQDTPAIKGDLVPVAFRTPMNIRNTSKADATFLIIKTPNPSEMAGKP